MFLLYVTPFFSLLQIFHSIDVAFFHTPPATRDTSFVGSQSLIYIPYPEDVILFLLSCFYIIEAGVAITAL